MKYIRIQVKYCSKTGKINENKVKLFKNIDQWFIENLLELLFYFNGNPDKAITYFKIDTTIHMIDKLKPLMDVLTKYKV